MPNYDIFPGSFFYHNIGYEVDCNCEQDSSSILAAIQTNTKTTADYGALELGQYGHELITDGSFSSETFVALVAYGDDATVTYTVAKSDGSTVTHTGKTLSFGDVPTYGIITSLTVSSGTVKAYYGE